MYISSTGLTMSVLHAVALRVTCSQMQWVTHVAQVPLAVPHTSAPLAVDKPLVSVKLRTLKILNPSVTWQTMDGDQIHKTPHNLHRRFVQRQALAQCLASHGLLYDHLLGPALTVQTVIVQNFQACGDATDEHEQCPTTL